MYFALFAIYEPRIKRLYEVQVRETTGYMRRLNVRTTLSMPHMYASYQVKAKARAAASKRSDKTEKCEQKQKNTLHKENIVKQNLFTMCVKLYFLKGRLWNM